MANWRKLFHHARSGGQIVWPKAGLGTGLAKLSISAPAIHASIERNLDALKHDISQASLRKDAEYAIAALTQEEEQTIVALANMEEKFKTSPRQDIPTERELGGMTNEKKEILMQQRSQTEALRAGIQGKGKRLDFIRKEIKGWRERINLSG